MAIPSGTMNLVNGEVNLNIPLASWKQRTGPDLTLSLVYDSLIFGETVVNNPQGTSDRYWDIQGGNDTAPVDHSGLYKGPAWRFILSGNVGSAVYDVETKEYSNGNPAYARCTARFYRHWRFIDGTGTAHPFPEGLETQPDAGGAPCPPANLTAEGASSDGSGYYIKIKNAYDATVYDEHGNDVTTGKDTNGNFFSYRRNADYTYTFLDQLGREILLPATVSIGTTNVDYCTNFGGYTINHPCSSSTPMVSHVGLPDGHSYDFEYDSSTEKGHYAAMTKMTLPTGGVVNLKFTEMSDGTKAYGDIRLTQITTPDGTWDISYLQGANAPLITTVKTPPDATTGTRNMTKFTRTYSQSGSYTDVIARFAGLDDSGTPASQTTTTYPFAGAPSETKEERDGEVVTDTAYTYDYINAANGAFAGYPGHRIKTRRELSSSGTLLRETDYTYVTDNAYTGNHIIDLPKLVTVYGSGGPNSEPSSQTRYSYDGTGIVTTSGYNNNSTSSTQDHADPAGVPRGNLTKVEVLIDASSYLARQTLTYNNLGQVVKQLDGNSHATEFDYSDSWGDNSCSLPANEFAYQTGTQRKTGPLTLEEKRTYLQCRGLLHSSLDSNDIEKKRDGTVYTYDDAQRVHTTSSPDGALTTTDYNKTAPATITTTISASPDPDMVTKVTLDGLGRTSSTVTGATSVSNTYDYAGNVVNTNRDGNNTSFVYDVVGRLRKTTFPGSVSSTSTPAGLTATVRDENGVGRTLTYDSLGRLTDVAELGTSSTPLSLETHYDYNDNDDLLTVTQSGSHVRSFTYDKISRLLTEHQPERGDVCYGTYVGSECSPQYDGNGNVKARTDSRGATLHYEYDDLDRITSKWATGSYFRTTTCFIYDKNGTTYPSNALGRLTAQWTQKGMCPSDNTAPSASTALTRRIVDEYDAVGRVRRQHTCTLSACTADHEQTYFYNQAGLTKSFTDGIGRKTFTLAHDSDGRAKSLTSDFTDSTHPANLFSVTVFGSSGWTEAAYGNNLKLTRDFDSRTRLKKLSVETK